MTSELVKILACGQLHLTTIVRKRKQSIDLKLGVYSIVDNGPNEVRHEWHLLLDQASRSVPIVGARLASTGRESPVSNRAITRSSSVYQRHPRCRKVSNGRGRGFGLGWTFGYRVPASACQEV